MSDAGKIALDVDGSLEEEEVFGGFEGESGQRLNLIKAGEQGIAVQEEFCGGLYFIAAAGEEGVERLIKAGMALCVVCEQGAEQPGGKSLRDLGVADLEQKLVEAQIRVADDGAFVRQEGLGHETAL